MDRFRSPRRSLAAAGIGALMLLAVGAAEGAAPNLHSTDWNAVTLPGAVCGSSKPIHLVAGRAVVSSSRWPGVRRVLVSREPKVAYGNFNGGGTGEAAVGVICSNDSGTAAGDLAATQVVFGIDGSSLHTIGIVTPRHPALPNLPPSLITVKLGLGAAIATEFFYGPHDADCCPSGRAKTYWLYIHGGLTAQPTKVTRQASK
ncbi:MAG TPA: hypothetical protein VH063_07645 [Gaiellaceae bacterium]|nr:hypothetical protein [Gaiellaceae bacterium]